ncbi:MAG: hypothetical protein GF365_02125 [Candidatus Buchananbacteria bacterium]|nr:hypothetical protein [Candidatus Buchananbacteria bacterium]
MEQPPQIEKKESLEKFAEELGEAIEAIQGLDFLVESEQLTVLEAKQIQMVLADFESWQAVEDDKAELVKIMQEHLGEHQEAIKNYELLGTEEVGEIKVKVYPTDQAGVNLAVYKYQDGDVVWALQPEEFQE